MLLLGMYTAYLHQGVVHVATLCNGLSVLTKVSA